MTEPQYVSDYPQQVSEAVRSVLIEITQVAGSYRDAFVVIGGAVPWLLLPDSDPPHVGTLDIDLALDPGRLTEGRYAELIELLERTGYQRQGELRDFQLSRLVTLPDGSTITVVVDFLRPKGKLKRKGGKLLQGFRVQEASGAELALQDPEEVRLNGVMPDGMPNTVRIRVANPAAFLVMKAHAIQNRRKQKDVYDFYFTVKHHGTEALAARCLPFLTDEEARQAFLDLLEKFSGLDAYGPLTVRAFLEESAFLGDLTPDQLQVDAYAQVRAFLDHLIPSPELH